ncbi:hypothetical protein ONZ43_g1018 [Nemania bipapillata]|uniref:Uncharacterized protein n=1 Tax=Nemania bipapillata TaxID=110536 RepID=A0ACC2J5W5_9PEZI|nr:hypothetical protein ONZ43_g1018 [Nemania bipapillata]
MCHHQARWSQVLYNWLFTKKRVFDMVGAFFGSAQRDWWLEYARNPRFVTPYGNHWLVRRSAARAFANGFVYLERLGSSMIEYRVSAHARLCNSIRFLNIARRTAPEILGEAIPAPLVSRPPSSRRERPILGGLSTTLSTIPLLHVLGNAILTLWLLAPSQVRVTAYELLRQLGKALYGGPNDFSTVQRLPFGLYLKYNGEPAGFRNEFNALRMHDLSDTDRERIVGQMRGYLVQIRSIPNLANTAAPICNTLGDETGRRGREIVFTHADLNPRNILVDEVMQDDGSTGWSVTGIVDWEFSGYYPEYWDYTKAMFESFRWIKRYNDMVKEIFKEFGDYSGELDVETRSWELGDGI